MSEFLEHLFSMICAIGIVLVIVYVLVNMQPATYDARMDLCVRYYKDYEYCKLKTND